MPLPHIPEQVSGKTLIKLIVAVLIVLTIAGIGHYAWNEHKKVNELEANLGASFNATNSLGAQINILTKSYCNLILNLSQGKTECTKQDGKYVVDENGVIKVQEVK